MSTPDEILATLLDSVRDLRVTDYVEASALAFITYNILLSFDDEVEHIWKSKWTTPKCLYIFSRYYGLFYLLFNFTVDMTYGLSPKFCRGYYWFYSFGGPVVFTSIINVIFLMRIYALYSAKVQVFIFLAALFVTELTAEMWISAKVSVSLEMVTVAADFFSGCRATSSLHNILIISWVPRLCASTIVFAMMLYKFFEMIPVGKHKMRRNVFTILPPVVERFMTDGTIFFFAIFSLDLFCMIVSVTVTNYLARIGLPWIVAVYSHCAARLVLNLRIAARGSIVQTDGNNPAIYSPPELSSFSNLHGLQRAAVPAPYPYIAYHTSAGDLVVARDIELQSIVSQ